MTKRGNLNTATHHKTAKFVALCIVSPVFQAAGNLKKLRCLIRRKNRLFKRAVASGNTAIFFYWKYRAELPNDPSFRVNQK